MRQLHHFRQIFGRCACGYYQPFLFHRYEVNNHYVPSLEKTGLVISARTPSEDLPEMMELPQSVHPWFVGVQFHPEFTSNPRTGHPLFIAYVQAALARKGVK